jgi:hypothetical protein
MTCRCEDRPCCGCHLEEPDGNVDMDADAYMELYERDPELFEYLMEMDR